MATKLLRMMMVVGTLLGICSSLPASKDTNLLERRQCVWNDQRDKFICDRKLPTLEQIRFRMQNATESGTATAGARAVFYTNLIDGNPTTDERWEMYAWCIGWLESRGIKSWYSTWNALDEGWRIAQNEYVLVNGGLLANDYGGPTKTKEGVINNWVGCFNQALSYSAQHEDAYLFTKRDTEWSEDSVWETAEFWVLTQPEGRLNKIWSVDPRPPDKGGDPCAEPTVLWDRAKDEAKPPNWKCPVREMPP